MDDQFSGRIFEYIWHYIFTGHEVYCPAENTCYCDGYGICFGGRQKFADYFAKQKKRNEQFDELEGYTKRLDKAKEEGTTLQFTEAEQARIQTLQKDISQMDPELEELRIQANKRGEDPKNRAEETENYDSSRIWDYAPKDN
jgi:hypothetical protein